MILSKRAKDLTGQRFGSLVAIKPSHTGHKNTVFWYFKCDCGNDHVARGNTVAHCASKANNAMEPSCGCYNLTTVTKHGYRRKAVTHPAYKSWNAMKNRCYNPKDPSYKWYGAKGVTVCDEWLDDPAKFVEWSVANEWEKGLHIDKDIKCSELGISPGIYSPETCQWVTAKTNVGYATNRDNHGSHPNVKLSHQQLTEFFDSYFNSDKPNIAEICRNAGISYSWGYQMIRNEREKRKVSSNVLINN